MELNKQIENVNGQAINSADNKINAVYSKQKQAMQEIETFIALLYFHYEINGSMKLSRAQKQAIFKELNTKLIRIYNELTSSEKETLINILTSNYKFLYDETFDVYNIGNVKKPSITEQEIMAAVMLPIAGEVFTDRIIKNYNKTINLLKKSFKNMVNGDIPSDVAKKQIEDIFGVTAYDTSRLSTSENTRVLAQASNDVCKVLGIKKHIWCATFENSCKHCTELHGQEYYISDRKAPTIPLHSNCKCFWVPSLKREEGKIG